MNTRLGKILLESDHLAGLRRTVDTQRAEMLARLSVEERIPEMNNGGRMPGTEHLQWMNVMSKVWELRIQAVGERNQALAQVETLSRRIMILERELRESQDREATLQTQVEELIGK